MKKLIPIIISATLILSTTACSLEEINPTIPSNTSSAATSDTDSVSSELSDTDTNITTDTDKPVKSDIIFDVSEDTDSDTNNNTVKTNVSTCKIFKKVVCCGDSYTAGYTARTDGPPLKVNEDYAWPHYMSTLTGNDWYNCGCSGCTVLTWQEHARGLPAAKKLGKSQAYVIGLMINDATSSTPVKLGTADDIGTDSETYYGGMSKIIRELNAISPNAKIFVNTCPKPEEEYAAYNQAVRDIVNAYKDKYPVHCIDLAENAYMYESDSLKNDYLLSHYTAIGYEQFAEIYAVILSDYINEHIEDFQDVAFIEYEK